jgi:predicted dehydrogenase
VLVEKPLGATAAECRPLRAAVAASGLVLQVGVMKRHDPGLEYARRAIREQLGPLVSFDIWYRAAADEYVDEASVFLPLVRNSAYRRPEYKLDHKRYYLANHGAHLFDGVRYLVGGPVAVQAALAVRGDAYSWHGLLRLADGGVGSFELTVYIHGNWSEGARAFGERGSLEVEVPNPFFLRPSRVRVFDAETRLSHEPLFAEGDAYLRQLDAFVASVLDGAPVRADVEDGIAALEVVEAVAASASANGALVEVERG